MLRKLGFLLIVLPLAAALVAFTVANRHMVIVSLDPFGVENSVIAFEMPVYVLIFLALLTGVVVGGVATWMKQGAWRKRARTSRFEAEKAKREARDLRREVDRPHTALPAP